MGINLIEKSSRLLQSRRYTTDGLNGAFEAFTRVLDLNASEIYSQQNLIPSASVPFSESGQNGYYYTAAGTISPTATGNDIMRYWFKHTLTPFETSRDVWYFVNPTSASLGTNQIIQGGQQTNFISPKYIVPGLAGNNAELGGYKVKVYVNDTAYATDSDYAFDYKTGVLQWSSSAVAPAGGAVVKVTVNQYVGKTLADSATSGFSGSFSGSLQGDATLNILTVTGSFLHTGSYSLTGSINVQGPVLSNGINVVDNAIAMAIALG